MLAVDLPRLARSTPLFGLFRSVPLGDPPGDCGVGLSGAALPMLTTMTVAPGRELSALASEHLRFSPGDARPEEGEAWPSKPETGSVSTEDE